MTQEEKRLLLKDLCARLPYRVFAEVGTTYDFENDITDLINIELVNCSEESVWGTESCNVCFWYNLDTYQVKPYLRSMEDMTEEEVKEFYDVECIDAKVGYIKPTCNWHFTINGFDWLNKHHFDYRGLIEKGLALPAPEGMYK